MFSHSNVENAIIVILMYLIIKNFNIMSQNHIGLRYRSGTSLSSWLYRIAYTTCIDSLKKKKILFFIPNTQTNDESKYISDDLKEALLVLSPKDCALVFSRVIDEKSYAELETIYNASAAALRKRYERAKTKLSKILIESNTYYTCLCLMFLIGVMAASIPSFNNILSFLSNKIILDGIETGVNLSNIKSSEATKTMLIDMSSTSGGGGMIFKEFEEKDTIKILMTDQMEFKLPKVDFMHISNIGYVNGFLHIQTKWNGNGIDDHGYFYFVDTFGNKIDINEGNIYFGTDQSGNTQYGSDYVEYIFDVENVNLNDAKLMGYFVSNGNYTKGDWKTTFKIQSVKEEKQIDCNIKFDSWIVNNISISPMGITLVGSGENSNSQKITISANMIDGSIQKFDSVLNYNDSGDIKLKFIPSIPLDISKVKSITVNENTLYIN